MRASTALGGPVRPMALILLFLLASLAAPAPSAGQYRRAETAVQAGGTQVEIGTRVRVYWTGRRPQAVTGRLLAADSDSIAVLSEPEGRAVRVSAASVDALKVSVGPQPPGRAAWNAALPALAVGAMLTTMLGLSGSQVDDAPCDCVDGVLPAALKVGVVATSLVAALRAANAYAHPDQRWRPVSPPLVVLPARTAGAGDTVRSTASP